jgi:hypothetical protein
MPASRYAATITGLISVFQAAAPAVTVFDGLTIGDDSLTEAIIVGASSDFEATDAGTFTQEYRTTGGASAAKDETVTIPCAVIVDSGDSSVATARARCCEILALLEDALRANYSLGLAPNVMWADLQSCTFTSEQSPYGESFRADFTITIQSVI